MDVGAYGHTPYPVRDEISVENQNLTTKEHKVSFTKGHKGLYSIIFISIEHLGKHAGLPLLITNH